MKITAGIVLDVVEDYLKILESAEKQDLNKIYLVRDCADALRDEKVEGWNTDEVVARLQGEVDELKGKVEALEDELDNYW